MAMQSGPQNDPEWLSNTIATAGHITGIVTGVSTFIVTAITATVVYLIRAARTEERLSTQIAYNQRMNDEILEKMTQGFARIEERKDAWEERVNARITSVEVKFEGRLIDVTRRVDGVLLNCVLVEKKP